MNKNNYPDPVNSSFITYNSSLDFLNSELIIHNSELSSTPPPPRNPYRIRGSGRRFPLWLLALSLIFLPACFNRSPELPTAQSSLIPNHLDPATYSVTRVIDGDTIVLDNGIHVRYIGINTPERGKPFYKEATEANRQLVEGKKVRLEYDVEKIQSKGKGRDRTLAYVYLEDGTFVNAWLVENGYARVSTYPPNVKYQDKFRELEKKAREGNKGLWGTE